MWRSNFTIPHSFAATFAAYILLPMFAAYIYRLHFEQAPIFYACANILSKCKYFDDVCNKFLLDFVAASICVYFQYLFMHFYVRQYFWAQLF
jgi:hypothetical protein